MTPLPKSGYPMTAWMPLKRPMAPATMQYASAASDSWSGLGGIPAPPGPPSRFMMKAPKSATAVITAKMTVVVNSVSPSTGT